MYFYDRSPNYEYLLKHYTRSWFKIYTERAEAGKSNSFLHDDGWMEININMNADSVAARTRRKEMDYKLLASTVELSPARIKAFNEIINYLRTKGSVYIVRIPTSQTLTAIEDRKYPHFSELLKDIGHKQNVKVFDFSKNMQIIIIPMEIICIRNPVKNLRLRLQTLFWQTEENKIRINYS
jgi:hypothetical protein